MSGYDYHQDEYEAAVETIKELRRSIEILERRNPVETFYDDVKTFHSRVVGRTYEGPIMIDAASWTRRIRLMLEELSETATAYALHDISKFADGLCDLTWVVLGTAVEADLPFNKIWDEVRRANMAKKGGYVDSNGKIHKPVGWIAPDIDRILGIVNVGTKRCNCHDPNPNEAHKLLHAGARQ